MFHERVDQVAAVGGLIAAIDAVESESHNSRAVKAHVIVSR